MPSIDTPHKSKRTKKITCIVIHDTGGHSAQSALSWFKNPASKVSAHVVVDKDGTVWDCVSDDYVAWHAGTSTLHGEEKVNGFSLGVEIVDNNDTDKYPEPQYKAVVKYVAEKCKKYSIPLNRVIGHNMVAPGRKVDPGADFPWNTFLLDVASEMTKLP